MSFTALLGLGQTALELALFNSLTVLALFLSYSMLNVCDLSTDGCFTLGAAVGAVVALAGHPWLSIPAAMGAGMLSGLIVATLQTRMGVNSLLAGIIVNTGLYSVNIGIMGGSSQLNMNRTATAFSLVKDALKDTAFASQYRIIVAAAAVVLVVIILSLFLRTRLGLAIRATGDNPAMVRSSSINADQSRVLGIMISNALVAFSGALLCQQQRYADLNFGSGMLVVGLASVIIGQAFFGNRGVTLGIISAVAGSLVYRVILQIAYKVEMPSYAVKLLSAVIVVIALTIPRIRRLAAQRRADREEGAQ